MTFLKDYTTRHVEIQISLFSSLLLFSRNLQRMFVWLIYGIRILIVGEGGVWTTSDGHTFIWISVAAIQFRKFLNYSDEIWFFVYLANCRIYYNSITNKVWDTTRFSILSACSSLFVKKSIISNKSWITHFTIEIKNFKKTVAFVN